MLSQVLLIEEVMKVVQFLQEEIKGKIVVVVVVVVKNVKM